MVPTTRTVNLGHRGQFRFGGLLKKVADLTKAALPHEAGTKPDTLFGADGPPTTHPYLGGLLVFHPFSCRHKGTRPAVERRDTGQHQAR